ncbi:cytochrome b/b6 domain-containing protein [Leptolyngbya ohadii]|uniref:cytochrome b/b6 domain-containing protein n=1 Tax=Leptolyngbya ohadii TaxID=1962290 RepID=UPI000B59AA8F|nr:cytochrome b/b6 domain-containing protein [Leptolyngbya ohadii]
MKPTHPYQPLLLRLLHGLTGIFVLGAIFTAYWTYETYDKRWGGIGLPKFPAIEGIHGTFGLWALLLFPAFAIYALRRGQKRLLQPNSLSQLSQPNTPIGWYTLHRGANTLSLLSLTFALFSGKMMGSTWLPNGELNHTWYYIHLVSWVVMVLTLGIHLLMSAKVGGMPLLLSIWQWRSRPEESPKRWGNSIQKWWHDVRAGNRSSLLLVNRAILYRVLEAGILLSLILAWIIPIFKGD